MVCPQLPFKLCCNKKSCKCETHDVITFLWNKISIQHKSSDICVVYIMYTNTLWQHQGRHSSLNIGFHKCFVNNWLTQPTWSSSLSSYCELMFTESATNYSDWCRILYPSIACLNAIQSSFVENAHYVHCEQHTKCSILF